MLTYFKKAVVFKNQWLKIIFFILVSLLFFLSTMSLFASSEVDTDDLILSTKNNEFMCFNDKFDFSSWVKNSSEFENQQCSISEQFLKQIDDQFGQEYDYNFFLNTDNWPSLSYSLDISMMLLHFEKVIEKLVIMNFKKEFFYKNPLKHISFFLGYLLASAYHTCDNFFSIKDLLLDTNLSENMIHLGFFSMSLLAKLYDCNCKSQIKNGHNIMILYHLSEILTHHGFFNYKNNSLSTKTI